MSQPPASDPRFVQLEAYVLECVQELFAAYDRPLEPEHGEVDPSASAVISVIGFAATGMRGSLLLLTPRATIPGLIPSELRALGPLHDRELRDLLGEFTNMLAGRVKNQLLAHGVEPMVSTPTTILGHALQVPPSDGVGCTWYHFRHETSLLHVRLDATFEDAFELAPADAALAPEVREGEMLLF